MLEKRIFLISPVRTRNDEAAEFLEKEYIPELYRAQENIRVHYPKWHTEQEDDTGLYICRQNRFGIKSADEVHIYLDPNSQGTVFDVGMSFMAQKPLYLVNLVKEDELPDEISRFIVEYAHDKDFIPGLKHIEQHSEAYQQFVALRKFINTEPDLILKYEPFTKEALLGFGMMFMSGKPITLENPKNIEPTPKKSFENVLLALHEKYTKA